MPVRMTALSGDSLAESCGGDAEKPFEPVGKVVTVAHVTGFRDIFEAEVCVQQHLFPLPEKELFPVFPGGTPDLFPENLEKKGYAHAALRRDLSDLEILLAGKKLDDPADPVETAGARYVQYTVASRWEKRSVIEGTAGDFKRFHAGFIPLRLLFDFSLSAKIVLFHPAESHCH